VAKGIQLHRHDGRRKPARPGELCEGYVNDQWFAAHASNELAAEGLLDQYKRAVRQELELLEIRRDEKQIDAFEDRHSARIASNAASLASWVVLPPIRMSSSSLP
jgi:hypothetical protein